jgi:hypothetical protein
MVLVFDFSRFYFHNNFNYWLRLFILEKMNVGSAYFIGNVLVMSSYINFQMSSWPCLERKLDT